jgi:hypothetical protein
MNNNSHYLLLVNLPSPNLHIITQTKNPTNVGLDVVERVNLFEQYHLLSLDIVTSLYGIQV